MPAEYINSYTLTNTFKKAFYGPIRPGSWIYEKERYPHMRDEIDAIKKVLRQHYGRTNFNRKSFLENKYVQKKIPGLAKMVKLRSEFLSAPPKDLEESREAFIPVMEFENLIDDIILAYLVNRFFGPPLYRRLMDKLFKLFKKKQ